MISYSAVILDEPSRQKLIERFKKFIPNDWEVIAHHQTINLGSIAPEWEKYLGMDINLTVEDIAMDDKVVAVGVSGFYSTNKKAHITLAVNRAGGGKPFMSNQLQNWKKVKPMTVTGKVAEVEKEPMVVKRLAAFDFDGTLFDSPEKENGKDAWSEKKGEPYPHKGWWGREESLDLDVFDIQPFPSVLNQLKKEQAIPNTYVIVLTSRQEHLRPQIQAILNKNNIHVHKLDMKDSWKNKGQKILDYIKEFPELEEINVYDDMDEKIAELKSVEEEIPDNINYNIYRADNGNLTLTESEIGILDIINEEINNILKI